MGEVQITHQEIISLCRLCLAKDLASVDIFEGGNELRHLYTKIVACLPVQVFSSDTLPHKICEVCNAKVDDFYQFWTSTAKNQKQLHEWLQIASDEKVEHVAGARIKVEVEDNNAEFDDYDDGTRVDDSEYEDEDEPSAPKRIKTTHSDDEEDRKPTDLVGSMPESSDASGKKKTKDHKDSTARKKRRKTRHTDENNTKQRKKETPGSSVVEMKPKIDKIEGTFRREQIFNDVKFIEMLETNQRFIKSEDDTSVFVKDEKEENFQCRLCMKMFETKKQRKSHERNDHPSHGIFYCDLCNYSSPKKNLIVSHKMRHNKEYSVFCDQCEAGFLNKNDLNEHNIKTHSAEPHTCPVCKRIFTNRGHLTTHIKYHSPSSKVHQCDTCGKSFAKKYNLKQHIQRLHLKQGSECKICHKILNSPEALYAHNRIHNDERPFVCPTCGKASRTSSALVVHLRTHTGEKPYKCEFCGKGFTQTSSLAVHRRIHTGQKPHECSLCSDKFTTKSLLNHHMLRKHK